MKNNLFYLFFFAAFLALYRIFPHPPNFTPILASAITAPFFVKDRITGMCIPVLAMFFSDAILGFHPYQFVIYATLLSISFFASTKASYIKLIFMSFAGSVWFFITTNFAVWIIWDFYPKSYEGLLSCYVLAIPFFKNTLLSTLVFSIIFALSFKHLDKLKLKINSLLSGVLNQTR